MIAAWAFRLLRALCLRLPTWALDGLASAVGTLGYWALPAKRSNARQNLRVLLAASGEQATSAEERRARRLARRSMVAYVGTLIDFLRVDRLREAVIRDTAGAATGWEHLDAALAGGRGAIFVTPHFGHWDLAAVLLGAHYPRGTIHAVAESFANPRLDELVTAQRRDYGLGVVGMSQTRQMVRVLREGKVLGILADRPVGQDDGVPVVFFGHRTQLPGGAAVLASLARCPILPAYLLRGEGGRWEARILPAIQPVRTGDRDADLRATMQLVAEALERVIRRSPQQWYMFRAMWPRLVAESKPQPARPGVRHAAAPGLVGRLALQLRGRHSLAPAPRGRW